jgi:hypothetical protein
MYCYCIINKVNMKRYIGITVASLGDRFTNHLSSARNGSSSVFHKAIRKYGESNFELEWYNEYDCDQQVLFEIEINEIKKHKTFVGSENSNGYNMTLGGEGGVGKEVIQIDKNSHKVINRYSSMSEAANKTNIAQTSISQCCLGEKHRKTAGGFYWIFKGTEFYTFTFRKVKITNKETKKWRKLSVLQLSQQLNISQLEINNLCNKMNGSDKYFFRYF